MTWMDLLHIVAGASAATGFGAGVVAGVVIQSRARGSKPTPPDGQECGSVCALAALPRDGVVTIRRRRSPTTPP